MVSCVSQVSMALWAALRFVLTWVGPAHEGKLGADGGRVNGMRWVAEEEEGCHERSCSLAPCAPKNTAYGFAA